MSRSKIYTKTGDKGETGLVSGTRTLKSDPRIDLYGEVDELNSRIGLLVCELSEIKGYEAQRYFLEKVQCSLFDLGSNLACEADKRDEWKLPQVTAQNVLDLESAIDEMDKTLEPLKNFILPGGHRTAAQAHLCRTSSRSVERQLVEYFNLTQEALPPYSIEFLNRLSDYFFILARWLNKQNGRGETIWKPQSS